MAPDRVFGLAVICLALAYIASASQTQTGFISDPVGSKTFPILVGAVAAVCGLVMVLRPDAGPERPEPRALMSVAAAVVVMIAYAYSLKPLGFLIPTAIAAAILSYQITPRPAFNAVTGTTLSAGLFALFKYALGLGLSPLPKGWM